MLAWAIHAMYRIVLRLEAIPVQYHEYPTLRSVLYGEGDFVHAVIYSPVLWEVSDSLAQGDY